MKKFLHDHAEPAVIFISIAIFVILKLVLANTFAMLNLYYIPVFLSAYYLGKKPAILTSFLSVLMAVLFAVSWPAELLEQHDLSSMSLNLLLWASFLILVSILFGTLNEIREQRVVLATEELLEQYLKQSIASTENHPARVARLARAIARQMHLPGTLIASLEAAALLHDIKETKHGLQLIADSMAKGLAENKVFGSALPIIIAEPGNISPHQNDLAIGSKILSVADAFDAVSHDFESVEPIQLLNDMEREERYDRAVTNALRHLLRREQEPDLSPA